MVFPPHKISEIFVQENDGRHTDNAPDTHARDARTPNSDCDDDGWTDFWLRMTNVTQGKTNTNKRESENAQVATMVQQRLQLGKVQFDAVILKQLDWNFNKIYRSNLYSS